ncbi:MAG TPA: DMT family transporter [Ktedonobacteraceae bacterium]|nr:DMT family transporter [Ktedonobacteraceae bacterium]
MKAKDIAGLLALSAFWGGSFLLIRIAAPVLGPVVLVELRVLLAGLLLVLYSLATKRPLNLRKYWLIYLMIGLLNSAIPFTLIATSELHLTAGLAAILNATSPLFGAVVAAIWLKETLTLKKVIGLVLGLVGVCVVMGWSPLPLTLTIILSVVASLTAAAFYGIGGAYIKIYAHGTNTVAIATCSQLGAALFLLPLTVVAPMQHTPSLLVALAVAALALVSTAIGYLIYFSLIANVGPTRALTVTFLAPVFGVLWGSVFLGEVLTVSTVLGFAIILLGTGFVTGIIKFGRKKEAVSEEVQEQQEIAQ